ncbi:hypothetical protein [Flavobacterium suzhouense]|uniref:DUF4890 domain-containing protein n=1 Tax=Flavobacterium suzhouense TaxID=1529638 RepID=A0ABW5NRF2_9FLAO
MFKTLISAAKAMLSVVALLLAFTLNASAQDRSANAAQRMTDNMKAELSLTDAQYAKVLDINKDFTAKSAEARKASTDKAAVGKSVVSLNEEREKQLKAVLTEEQYKNYLLKKDEKKKMARQRFDGQAKPMRTAQPVELRKE